MSAPAKTSKKIVVDDETLKNQAKASDPQNSAWVSANAGSGKTYVLTQRVVRLLLAGFDPSRILCLTFTKSAAAEMSNRVFKILSDWAVMDETKLSGTLTEITGVKPGPSQLKQARRLFARALETPGGLKIQTIHAFCEALLHQFPLEANIAGHFEIMDERAQAELIDEAKRKVIIEAYSNKQSPLGRALAELIDIASDFKIDAAIGEFIKKRHSLVGWLKQAGGVEPAIAGIRKSWGIAEHATAETISKDAFLRFGDTITYLRAVAAVCANSDKVTDTKLAEKINAVLMEEEPGQHLRLLTDIWLTWDSKLAVMKPRSFSRFATKPVKLKFPDLEELLDTESQRIIEVLQRLNMLRQLEASKALFTIADAIIHLFEITKRARGLLDFDDLIVLSANLLGRSDASQWVQYKLDQGIDHVLVDEAQDTNPRQWQVISTLIGDFFSGKGVHDTNRTIFAVGDEKQSIYSFQGAEPDAFADQRDRLKKLATRAEKNFENVKLHLSFRSVPDVLSAVDQVFSTQENFSGLGRDGDKTVHGTTRHQDPGLVEIWPLIKKIKQDEPDDWEMPVDQLTVDDPQILLANRIADQVQTWLENDTVLEGKGRPIKAGDILILVRSRDRFSSALTRELKQRNVPVAGSDRLRLTDHIAVLDLIALARFILLPQDDLSLAAVLKSPIFEFDEDLLLELAHGRGAASMFASLKIFAQTNATAKSALLKIEKLMARASQLRVYEFFATLLGADGERQRILNRIGQEAEDVLDAFLAQTLTFEQSGLPGLENFVDWLMSTAPDIKREFDLEDNTIKIMTVHAAKGLEAPIVFLVDKGAAPYRGNFDPALVEIKGPADNERAIAGYLWVPDKKSAAPEARAALDNYKQRSEAEHLRLLYVAMTRAEDRLIICGTAGIPGANERCWHSVVMHALLDHCSEHMNDSGELLCYRWQSTKKRAGQEKAKEDESETLTTASLPSWIDVPAATEPSLPKPLTPSGAQAMIDAQDWVNSPKSPLLQREENPSFALQRGIAIHRLLQVLPDIGLDADPDADEGTISQMRHEAANRYLMASYQIWSEAEIERIVTEVFSILDDDEFGALFAAGKSAAEVAVSGTVELGGVSRFISGQIDRLVVTDDQVVIVDYKTNRFPPMEIATIPAAYLSQLALYQLLICRIYPNHNVRSALLWSETPKLMFIPQTMLDAQLEQIAQR